MNRTEELAAISRTVDRIIADPELSRQFLFRAGIIDTDGNLTDQYISESEKHMRLIPPPPLEILVSAAPEFRSFTGFT